MRRTLLFLCLCSVLAPVFGEDAKAPPKDLQPVPEPPPLPAAGGTDQSLEPQITIIKKGETQVEEYRINGRLYMVKVTPAHGKPYYLVDERGDGHFTRQDNLDSGVRVPQWVLFQF